jgi:SEC-C motif-containing protein
MKSHLDLCPCGSGVIFLQCCEPFLNGDIPAPTAEALMRSRYTAYVLVNEAYLLTTWHTSTRPASLSLNESQPDKWLGLKILSSDGGSNDQQGSVEFIARYKVNGKAGRLHEVSEFVREAGQWFYVKGTLIE